MAGDDAERIQAADVLAAGWLDGPAEVVPLGEGHIHLTLLVTGRAGERFVLQRINREVFPDPARVMANLERVLAHFAKRAPGLLPVLLRTRDGDGAFVDRSGEWWRLWRHVDDARALVRSTDPDLCEAAGRAFGRFQRILADLPGGALPPSIPGFLQLAGYLDALDAARRGDVSADRVLADACDGIAFIDARRDLAQRFPPGDDLIHGDCKLNNLLFDAHGPSVRTVLDLDTVMTGHWAWDFGDLARSALAGTVAAEVATPALAALARGFADGSGRVLTPATVVGAPVYVAFMLGVRFLTDHLLGDRYFRVSHAGENLSRARTQFELVRLLESLPAPAGALAPAATRE